MAVFYAFTFIHFRDVVHLQISNSISTDPCYSTNVTILPIKPLIELTYITTIIRSMSFSYHESFLINVAKLF